MTKLEFFSLGLVAQDKVKDDWFIYVIPIEKVPSITGDVSERIHVTGEVKDKMGNITSLQTEKKKFIKAEWLEDGTNNRVTPPDVTKGMTVKLYNYAGTNKYYWSTLYHEADLYKKEKVVYLYSNKPEVKNNTTADELRDNAYYIQVDTYDKFIRVHTANNDGEKVSYDVELDGANGVFTLKDSNSNKIELLSQDGTLNINVNKEFNVIGNDNYTIKTPKNLEIELDKLSIKNNTAELVDLLIQWIDLNINEHHKGNMGAPTDLMETDKKNYMELKKKLQTFKK